jgi:hypothetical protein
METLYLHGTQITVTDNGNARVDLFRHRTFVNYNAAVGFMTRMIECTNKKLPLVYAYNDSYNDNGSYLYESFIRRHDEYDALSLDNTFVCRDKSGPIFLTKNGVLTRFNTYTTIGVQIADSKLYKIIHANLSDIKFALTVLSKHKTECNNLIEAGKDIRHWFRTNTVPIRLCNGSIIKQLANESKLK